MPNKEWDAPPTYRSRCHCIIVFLSFDSLVEDVDKSSEVLVGLLGGRESRGLAVVGWRPPLAVGFIWDIRYFQAPPEPITVSLATYSRRPGPPLLLPAALGPETDALACPRQPSLAS